MQSTNYMTTTPSYKISKAALNMLTVIYAYELQEEDFTVFCVSPGVSPPTRMILTEDRTN